MWVITKAAITMVVRNARSQTLYVASKLINCKSPHVVEVLALSWASKYAEDCEWKNIICASDAAEVVKEVHNVAEPQGWDTCYELIEIRWRFSLMNWYLVWNPRETIKLLIWLLVCL